MKEPTRGEIIVGMVRALADDVKRTVARLVASERVRNPMLLDIVSTCATGLAFHQTLAELLERTPAADRAVLRTKILEWAENTVAGLPTPLPGADRN